MFILELTLRSWNHSEENKRRTLQRNDIAAAITRTDIFDFLVRSPWLPASKQDQRRGCLGLLSWLPRVALHTAPVDAPERPYDTLGHSSMTYFHPSQPVSGEPNCLYCSDTEAWDEIRVRQDYTSAQA